MVTPLTPIGQSSLKNALNPVSLRLFILKDNATEISFNIPFDQWSVAEEVREQYHMRQNPLQATADTSIPQEQREIELFIDFLEFSSAYAYGQGQVQGEIVTQYSEYESVAAGAEDSQGLLKFITCVFSEFCNRYCKVNNIHVTTASYPKKLRLHAIQTYYKILDLLVSANTNNNTIESAFIEKESNRSKKSAIFQAVAKHKASVFAVFGGQGSEDYFDEINEIYSTYEAMVKSYLERMACILEELASKPELLQFFPKGLHVLKWLEEPETLPDKKYLVNAPISLPLVGLCQLLHYTVLYKSLGKTPDEMRRSFIGTTGHSQGIISSVVVSSSGTEEEFIENSEKALSLLFWIGVRSQMAYPETTINPKILQDSLNNDEGEPTPMISFANLPVSKIVEHIKATNQHLPEDRKIQISLYNGPRSIVCSGHPQSLYGLNVTLRKLKAQSNIDQNRIPFSQRKIRFSSRFLQISVPFHCDYLKDVNDIIMKDVERDHLILGKGELAIPIYSTENGEDLRGHPQFTYELIKQICTLPVHWEKATSVTNATHILEFGPVGAGVGLLTHRNKIGTGVQVILANSLETSEKEVLCKDALFNRDPSSVKYSMNWEKLFAPKLVKSSCNGKIYVETRFSRLIGKPPLMVGGMTPTTANENLVGACINAGYHIELAGGGQHSTQMIRDRIKKIMSKVPSGEGITMNIMFLNAFQWGFQYPLVQEMRKEGIPLEGLCIAAGVPSLDVANEILANLKACGIKHVAFKPGSVSAIQQVIAIAKQNPDMPIIMQWTGGRAGGHHSFEDFHQPIIDTYAAIRRQPNIIIVVGSGFGDAEGTLPYLTGDWARKFGYPPMPFDGILFGSRILVAAEAGTSEEVKKLLVASEGIENEKEWENTYKGSTGGIVTVKSELGEPIHKVATRGVLLWKELDETIFNLPAEKQLPALLARKEYIVKRLNKDYQKVWFPKKYDVEDPEKVVDLKDMTYYEVLRRMLELMYPNGQWIDVSLRMIYGDFFHRTEERFYKASEGKNFVSFLQSYEQLEEDPVGLLEKFMDERVPEARAQLLNSDDLMYFLNICGRRDIKPPPYIPIMDKSFKYWFKKDSLWQSEHLDAVVGQDPGRVCILQGPVAVRHSTKANEPIGSILESINQEHIKELKMRYYQNSDTVIPIVDYFGGAEIRDVRRKIRNVTIKGIKNDNIYSTIFEITAENNEDLPDENDWFDLLGGQYYTWLHALLTSKIFVKDDDGYYQDNCVRRILRPKPQHMVEIRTIDDKINSLTMFTNQGGKEIVKITIDDKNVITVLMSEYSLNTKLVQLPLLFQYKPEQGYAPIHEIMEGRNERIKRFYYDLWFGLENGKYTFEEDYNHDPKEPFISVSEPITRQQITDFVNIIGNQAESYTDRGQKVLYAPMDFAIVVGWQSIIRAIFPKFINADLLKLVHLSNGFRMIDNATGLKEGDIVKTESRIISVINDENGKIVEVKGVLKRDEKPFMEVISKFFYRGVFTDYESTFKNVEEKPYHVTLKTKKDVRILESLDWFKMTTEEEKLEEGDQLLFELNSEYTYKTHDIYSKVKTVGTVKKLLSTKVYVDVAKVDYSYEEPDGSCGNPVVNFMERNGMVQDTPDYFENGGYSIMPKGKGISSVVNTHSSNLGYSRVSGDVNPIHTNPYFAQLADLPGNITHGMWTSASTRKFVETFAAENHPQRVTSYEVNFLDMVFPGDRLETKLYHTGMANGKKIIKCKTINQNGQVILEGTAEVEQPITAYVFTGQGAQEVGMGMDLYEKSPVAREIWDRADKHLMENYGFSIIDIVKNNPTEITIYFGNVKGQQIRKNYQQMTYEHVNNEGVVESLSLFPEIDDDSVSYTFRHIGGLLSATQFTQPSLVLMEKAAFEEMRSRGYIQQNSAFAGHSLGEYAALTAIGDVLSIETLVDVVFYRGMTMQRAVQRDSKGRSDYAMCAVNPVRVGSTFNESALQYLVASIKKVTNGLIEIVNYNVDNWQYVVSGDLISLQVLTLVLNYLKFEKIDLTVLLKTLSEEELQKQVNEIINNAYVKAKDQKKKHGFIKLERGAASIPLRGIDVPFHSSFLLRGVAPFRQYLMSKFDPKLIDVNRLIGNYIPNLTAEPFSLEKKFIENIYAKTNSTRIKNVLKGWTDDKYASPLLQQKLGYILLIELLAYQFASAVRWIETQDRLFVDIGVERLIEIGPGPTLSGMAQKTLKFKYEYYDDATSYRREILSYSKNYKEIFYDFEDEDEPEKVEEAPKSAPAAAPAPAPAPVAAPVPVAAPAAPAAAVADEDIQVKHLIHILIAQKLKKSVQEVPMSATIKDLVGGKSTLQNEVLGDLQKEFGSSAVPDKSEELPLSELAGQIGSGSIAMGKYSQTLVNKLIGSKMAAGFTKGKINAYLSQKYGLGPKRSDALLLFGLTNEPASRFGSEDEAKAWLDKTASMYSGFAGVSLSAGAPAAAAPMAMAMAAAPVASAGAASVADEDIQAKHLINILIAQKLKKSAQEVPMSATIKDLVGGKSTLQNEVLGDLQKEFGSSAVPDKSEELPLSELAGQIASGPIPMGKYSQTLVNKLISSKMAAGFTKGKINDYLSQKYGLGPKRTDALLLFGLTDEPASRFGSEDEAKAWLDKIAPNYFGFVGVSAGAAPAAGAAVSVPMAAVSSGALAEVSSKYEQLIREQLDIFMNYLDIDPRKGYNLYEEELSNAAKLRAELDVWINEHGDDYAQGIKPIFDPLKVRKYDSYWNWVYQESLILYYDILYGRLAAVDRKVTSQCIHVMNRADQHLLDLYDYKIDATDPKKGSTYELAKDFAQILRENCSEAISENPVYKDVEIPKKPQTIVTEQGEIKYSEVPRPGVSKMESYIKLMQGGSRITRIPTKHSNRSIRFAGGNNKTRVKSKKVPFLFLKDTKTGEYDEKATKVYYKSLYNMANDGITFKNKYVLVTGCGRNSIGSQIIKGLLNGGAKIIATTSRFSKVTMQYYRQLYEDHGSKGSCLIVVPFNAASTEDVNRLIEYIYSKDPKNGLGWDLDYVIPFAAISENGRTLENIDSRSELAHRIMLTNLLRMLGKIVSEKEAHKYDTRPAQCILPMSPNHGTFGGDGLYSESKIALETLFNRWHSEGWGGYLTIVGAVIGWTRGTGLMNSNNLVAEGIEMFGVHTFSTHEMAFNLIGLMHNDICKMCLKGPVFADLNGGLQFIDDLNSNITMIRTLLNETSEIRRSIKAEKDLEKSITLGKLMAKEKKLMLKPRANLKFTFPKVKPFDELKKLDYLSGMIDLDRTVVVTGYGEVGPYGNSRTRWEMEAYGKFSLEGCIEMAWIMGMIKYAKNKKTKDGKLYSGWVDSETGEPVQDFEVKAKYEERILKHTGIRFIEPELFNGYDPNNKVFYQEVAIDHDLPGFECSKEEAEQFKKKHGDRVDIYENAESGQWTVKIKKGSSIYIPKALQFDRTVAAQIPTGWKPETYGVPKSIIDQVDPITLYVIVATVEALISSGITDPYEFYEYVHVSEVGNCSGGGVGGMTSNHKQYFDRVFEKPVQSDILQECFINTMPAWINLLLLSSSGPIKTPVGACATAVESVEIGLETILSGKAKIVIVGGYDDFQEEGSYEFAQMKATSNSLEELAHGRDPSEMSRPATTTRAGFMEAQGAGHEILMTASLAIKMGVPIYGIIAHTSTATDKEGRSVPAPGQGILTTARESHASYNPLLDFKYRARQMKFRRKQIKLWIENELELLQEEMDTRENKDDEQFTKYVKERTAYINKEAKRLEKEALRTYGNEFYKNDPTISPLRGALAVFGLTIDDIQALSFHGTSTKANDSNESEVFNKQFKHLGRTKGNACPVITQKYLTGHPKGAAASWMLNGMLQVIETGIIPGNRNADNIDEKLRKFEYLFYPSRSIHTDGVKAGLLKSFGFGQVGGEVLVISPDYVLGTLTKEEYDVYLKKREVRQQAMYRYLHDSMTENADFVQVKDHPPYDDASESSVYLDPLARASYDKKEGTWKFNGKREAMNDITEKEAKKIKNILQSSTFKNAQGIKEDSNGIGVDVELVTEIPISNQNFLERNFTPKEIEYCMSRPDPQSSFAGRWSAKEAVIKAVSSRSTSKVWTKGEAAPLVDIEILPGESGAPVVEFHGDAEKAVKEAGINSVKVTISHSGGFSCAMAMAE
ncbi:fatty acid synthase [Piromyces finnis]|uniref:Fatty acid synthase n=1 Tax=Piromyces finnis TaxID=1754191 RepID=A0A1Y1V6T7_9FUNG|nr:fatty acid synthase [Piromyces finnis]|eukprot:ORX48172.1 fatty acid synthase [Piromyces finnis]